MPCSPMRTWLLISCALWCACERSPAATPVPDAGRKERSGWWKPIGGVEGDNPGYDRQRDPGKVIAALKVPVGATVADLGAGRGYFVKRLAAAVGPGGHLVATDIDEDALASLRQQLEDVPQATVRQGLPDDPSLEPGAYDLVLMSEMDHFLADRAAFLRKVAHALKPGGRIAVMHLTAMRPPLEAAAHDAGLVVLEDVQGVPDHFLLVFQPAQ